VFISLALIARNWSVGIGGEDGYWKKYLLPIDNIGVCHATRGYQF